MDPQASFWRLALIAAAATVATSVVLLVLVASDSSRQIHSALTTTPVVSALANPGSVAADPISAGPAGAENSLPARLDADLQAVVEAALGEDREHFSVAVYRFRDGRAVTFNGDRPFYAASLFKLALAYEAEVRHSRGELSFDDKLQITEADVAEDLGTVGYLDLAEDGTITLGAALEAMITLSDNTTAVALLHYLGGAAVDETLAGLGLQNTSVNTIELPTTADDMAFLMAAVYAGTGLDGESAAHLRDLLLRQTWRSGIPLLLPDGVAVGNKTGTWEGDTHDVGFVEAPSGAYVLAILCDVDYDWDAIARLSLAVYEELERM